MGLGGWGLAYPNWPADVQAQYTFDPALSKQLLAAAKFDTSITYPLILETDADQGLYQIVQSELAAVGINLSITLLTAPTWQATVMTSHNYTAFCAATRVSLDLISISSGSLCALLPATRLTTSRSTILT